MKWNSNQRLVLPRLAVAAAGILIILPWVANSQDNSMTALDYGGSAQTTVPEALRDGKQSGTVAEEAQSPLEYDIDPERVKKNQEVLDELYRNVYRYDSGVFNYEKKMN